MELNLDICSFRSGAALCLAATAGARPSAYNCVATLDKGKAIVCELRLAVDRMAHSDPAPLFVTVH